MTGSEIPAGARRTLTLLEQHGHEAYLVGGCVRDSLLALAPGDWDICTSARPEETKRALSAYRLVETGLRHGTVTALVEGQRLEITTFRRDGVYSDGRRPDSVAFTPSLREDLARRDFTCNAMAWSEKTGLVDPFGGADDLKRGLLRCVGEPERRFVEDALRLLRALRFAARFGFAIERDTAAALRGMRAGLCHVSAERIFSELRGILAGRDAGRMLSDFPEVFLTVLPELAGSGLPPAAALGRAGADIPLRLALLLSPAGREGAEAALTRLRSDGATRREVAALLRGLEAPPPAGETETRRELAALGAETARRLAALRWALAASETACEGAAAAQARLETAIAAGGCLSLRELAVKGGDLREHGWPANAALGETLNALLSAVLAGEISNDKAALLAAAERLRQQAAE